MSPSSVFTFPSFTMRNKLKRSKNLTGTVCHSKDQTAAVMVSPDDDDDDDGDSASLAAGDKHGSNAAAGFSHRQVHPLQEERRTLCATGAKIAPIFLQHRRRKRRHGGEPGQPVVRTQKPVLPPQSDDVQLVSHLTGPARSARRGQLSPSALTGCLEEIQTCNPAFPARTVFSALQKKASEGLQERASTECSSCPSFSENHLKEKRKRGNEISERVPKRLRSSLTAEGAAGRGHCHLSAQDVRETAVPPVKNQPRSSKLSHTRRLKQQSLADLVNNCDPNSGWRNLRESDTQPRKGSDTIQRVSCFEDVLWTDKYSPQHSSEVIGNSASLNKLHSWLKKWKLRADREERRRKMEERKREGNSHDSWDCGDFQGEVASDDGGDEPLCNTMLITGPSGVGKTASVYACAQELGFKVFEVNCSSQRSGRHVLSQLKEATQSHLVEMSGKDSLKPAYFNNYNANTCAPKSETLSGKPVLPKTVTSTSTKRAARRLGCKVKAKPATVTLARYFKTKAKADHFHFGGLSLSEKPDSEKLGDSSPGSDQTLPQDKKTATSLILFEEVDVIFDDDVGFLAAIKAFMTTTKRPVILTTNDPLFKERFDCSQEEIIFKPPSAVNVCSYLQLVCLAEGVRVGLDDVGSLLSLTCGDVRRCLLQLQLWAHSGGRRASQNEPVCAQYSNATEEGDSLDSQLPPCEAGCSADMLGLHLVTPNHLLNLLKSQSETDMNTLLKVLAESWRRGVPLLYSNLELLQPLGAEGTSVRNLDKVTYFGQQSEPAPSHRDLNIRQWNRHISPKSVTNSKSVRNISGLGSSWTPNPQKTSSLNEASSRVPSSSDRTEQTAAKVTADCLDALTDFFDLMSYLDATLPAARSLVSGSCTPEAFVWTGAELKDGLSDEVREEDGKSWSQERLSDIQAAAEGLGCHGCWRRASEVWTEGQKCRRELEVKRWEEGLALNASSERQSLSFSFQPLCAPSLSQRRYKLSRTVLSSKSFSLLGNRQAVTVDYMPVLRSICRSHRAQQQHDEPVRCLNYLSSTRLGLSKSTMQLLAEDFT